MDDTEKLTCGRCVFYQKQEGHPYVGLCMIVMPPHIQSDYSRLTGVTDSCSLGKEKSGEHRH